MSDYNRSRNFDPNPNDDYVMRNGEYKRKVTPSATEKQNKYEMAKASGGTMQQSPADLRAKVAGTAAHPGSTVFKNWTGMNFTQPPSVASPPTPAPTPGALNYMGQPLTVGAMATPGGSEMTPAAPAAAKPVGDKWNTPEGLAANAAVQRAGGGRMNPDLIGVGNSGAGPRNMRGERLLRVGEIEGPGGGTMPAPMAPLRAQSGTIETPQGPKNYGYADAGANVIEYDPAHDRMMTQLHPDGTATVGGTRVAVPGQPMLPAGATRGVLLDPKFLSPGDSRVGYATAGGGAPAPAPPGASAPNWTAQLAAKYPALAQAGSPQNKAFLDAYRAKFGATPWSQVDANAAMAMAEQLFAKAAAPAAPAARNSAARPSTAAPSAPAAAMPAVPPVRPPMDNPNPAALAKAAAYNAAETAARNAATQQRQAETAGARRQAEDRLLQENGISREQYEADQPGMQAAYNRPRWNQATQDFEIEYRGPATTGGGLVKRAREAAGSVSDFFAGTGAEGSQLDEWAKGFARRKAAPNATAPLASF